MVYKRTRWIRGIPGNVTCLSTPRLQAFCPIDLFLFTELLKILWNNARSTRYVGQSLLAARTCVAALTTDYRLPLSKQTCRGIKQWKVK